MTPLSRRRYVPLADRGLSDDRGVAVQQAGCQQLLATLRGIGRGGRGLAVGNAGCPGLRGERPSVPIGAEAWVESGTRDQIAAWRASQKVAVQDLHAAPRADVDVTTVHVPGEAPPITVDGMSIIRLSIFCSIVRHHLCRAKSWRRTYYILRSRARGRWRTASNRMSRAIAYYISAPDFAPLLTLDAIGRSP